MGGKLKERTKAFSLRIIRLVENPPKGKTSYVIGNQLLRSGTSVGANYRSAKRAKSKRDFIAKMGIVEEECDESIFWMELLVESGLMKKELLSDLMSEADEILRMVVSSITTAKKNK